MQSNVRICVAVNKPDLGEQVTRLCAAEGWQVALRQPDTTLDLPEGTHVLVCDQTHTARQWNLPHNVICVVITHTPPATQPAQHIHLLPEDLTKLLVSSITRRLNIGRFQSQFFDESSAEPITQLPHHQGLLNQLDQHRGQSAGLMVLRIDHAEHLYAHLDPVSKTDLLSALGMQLAKHLPEQGQLGIYDAATFVFTCLDMSPSELEQAALALQGATQTPLAFRGGQLHFSLSIGWSCNSVLANVQDLWREAWQASEHAQQQGGNCVHRDDHTQHLAARIPEALQKNEFSLALQPQWHVADGRISGVEALLRWEGMDVGNLAPDHFIPLFEQTNQMTRVGDWVLEHAARASANWLEQLVNPIRLGVNISPQQFVNDAINKQLQRLISEQWLDPTILELEMIHSSLLQVVDQHRTALFKLRDLGVHLAIDNLGRNLVDTKTLLRCPADTLKIDRSLVAAVDKDPAAVALIEQICLLGQRFNLRVIGVGVETPSQRQQLGDLGCTDLQGYLLSEPIALDEFPRFISQHQA
jgi:EAL domain-containing protein (putative c-di-GMP-specific phosphodiesterase class I)/GGDEF domain-containing protein